MELNSYNQKVVLGDIDLSDILKQGDTEINHAMQKEIAVIGIALRTAYASDYSEFWNNLINGMDCIRKIPYQREKDLLTLMNVQDSVFNPEQFHNEKGDIEFLQMAYLEDIDKFDSAFFHITPKEAGLMDPCQRIMMETIYNAIEDAGYGGKKIRGTNTGIYIGFSNDMKVEYFEIIKHLDPDSIPLAVTGNLTSVLSSRIAYYLDLRGPCLSIDTACSSSLVAVHQALQAIRNGDCDMAIAGGVRLNLIAVNTKHKIGIESNTFRTKAFDENADGTGTGEGVAALLMKPLTRAIKDYDHIYAVIRGSAVNNDGKSMGLTTPNIDAQKAVIQKAWRNADVNPETLNFIEAHGTGTSIGDPLELEALNAVSRKYTSNKHFCAIGTVKTNIGHLFEASGIFGLIKSILAVKFRKLPPCLHLQSPNRKINWQDSAFYVNTTLQDYCHYPEPLRGGVSAFGLSGTNCHIVLESPPAVAGERSIDDGPYLFTLSANSINSLKNLLLKYKEFLIKNADTYAVGDVCYTVNIGRQQFKYRIAIIVKDKNELNDIFFHMDIDNFRQDSRIFYSGNIIEDNEVEYDRKNKEPLWNELRAKTDSLIEQYFKSESREEILKELCNIYINGFDTDWEKIYFRKSFNKVHLPHYCFDRTRSWIKISDPLPSHILDNQFYYKINWRENTTESERDSDFSGAFIVFKNDEPFSNQFVEELSKNNKSVIVVQTGEEFRKINESKYEIRITQDDFVRLFIELKSILFSRIIHLFSIEVNDQAINPEDLAEWKLKNLIALFFLSKAYWQTNIKHDCELIAVTANTYKVTGTEKKLKPENASIHGLINGINNEFGNIKTRNIDVDDSLAVSGLLSEIEKRKQNRINVYREGKWYSEEFCLMDISLIPDDPIQLKNDGAYIVTGGMGGLGKEICLHLAAQCPGINLVLISRSSVPDKNLLNTAVDRKSIDKIRTIREMEEAGAHVYCYSADVSDYAKMHTVFSECRSRLGKIRGVIHAAGNPPLNIIVEKSEEDFHNIVSPKIDGTMVIHKLTMEDNLDFFVLFSSIASFLSGMGTADYAAANAYLDAFSEMQNMLGKRTLAINWCAWKETGMAVGSKAKVDLIFKDISTRNALKAFNTTLNKKTPRAIVGELNTKSERIDLLFNSWCKISDEITVALKNQFHEMTEKTKKSKLKTRNSVPVVLEGRPDNNYTELERSIGQAWADVLEYSVINIYKSFYDLGGDSIIAMMLINRLKQTIDFAFSPKDIFQYNNIHDISRYFEKTIQPEMEKQEVPLKPVEKRDYYPLSYNQMRFFILDQFDRNSPNYNIPVYLLYEGKFHKDKIISVLNALLIRHETLRTSFTLVEDKPVQVINAFNIEPLFTANYNQPLDEFVEQFIKPFDLTKGPLFRIVIIDLPGLSSALFMDIHHIIADYISASILLNDFLLLYNDLALLPVNIQYKDYSVWQQEKMLTNTMQRQEDFWLNIFGDSIPELDLPADFSRPRMQSYKGDKLLFRIEQELYDKIMNFIKENNITLSVLFFSILNILVAGYSGQSDIVVGTPVTNRNHTDLENTVGVFINTLALRNFPAAQKKFSDFMLEVKENFILALENSVYPFESLIDKLNLKRDISRNPLFNIMFSFYSNKMNRKNQDFFRDNKLKVKFVNDHISKFDLTLNILEYEKEIYLEIEYCVDLFKESTMHRFNDHYLNILKSVLHDKEIQISDLNLLTETENKRIIEFNPACAVVPRDKTFIGYFEEQVDKNSGKTAVISEGKTYSYELLNEKSNQIARFLQANGVRKGELIAVCGERSFILIAAILGIIKAGCAFLPVDHNYPGERIAYMLEKSGVRTMVSPVPGNDIRRNFKDKVIEMDDDRINQFCKSDVKADHGIYDLLYVIFTSGTTGLPKGVKINHSNLISILHGWRKAYLNNLKNLKLLQMANLSFDVFIADLARMLLNGGTLVILPSHFYQDPAIIYEYMVKYDISILDITPAAALVLADYIRKQPGVPGSLELFILGSDSISIHNFHKIYDALDNRVRLLNCYGITETTIDSTYFEMVDDKLNYRYMPVGKPFQNTLLYILNEYKQKQPIGIPGELYIGGGGVGMGYINAPELTAERFIDDPFQPGSRMYKTGDLVRWTDDGNIEFIGRMDTQVKIRGYRIELEEIESVFGKNENIKDCSVIANEHQQLVAFYVLNNGKHEIQEKKAFEIMMKNHLLNHLPDYMVPELYINIDKIPLTSNKKADRRFLQKLVNEFAFEKKYIPPSNVIEEKIIEIYQQVLNVQEIGVLDNFFESGGNSLNAVVAAGKLQAEFDITVNDIFEYATIRDLAGHLTYNLDNLRNSLENLKNKITAGMNNEPDPLSNPRFSAKVADYHQQVQKYHHINLDETVEYQDILLTGSTGYLGSYLLYDLLKNTNSSITLIIRADSAEAAKKRIIHKMLFYFNEDIITHYQNRISIYPGDMGEKNFGLPDDIYRKLLGSIDCIINSAANVRHFGRYQEFKQANIDAVNHLILFAGDGKAKIIQHISTIDIVTSKIKGKTEAVFTEEDLDIGQEVENYYLKSKWEAEKNLFEAKNSGLAVNIFRIGAIMFDSESGMFQENIEQNAMYNVLQSIAGINAVPLMPLYQEFSFVNYVSRAVVLLIRRKNLHNEVFHIFNPNHFDVIRFLRKNSAFKNIQMMPLDEFFDFLYENHNHETLSVFINRILNYFLHIEPVSAGKNTYVKILADKTLYILKRLNFYWPVINQELINKMIAYCQKIKFL